MSNLRTTPPLATRRNGTATHWRWLAIAPVLLSLVSCDSAGIGGKKLDHLSLWGVDTAVDESDRVFAGVTLEPRFAGGEREYSAAVDYGVRRLFVLASEADEDPSVEAVVVLEDGTTRALPTSSSAETFSITIDSINIGVVTTADGETTTTTDIKNRQERRTVDGADLAALEVDANLRWVLEPLPVGRSRIEIRTTDEAGEPTRLYLIEAVRREPDLSNPVVRERYFEDSLAGPDLEGVRRSLVAGSEADRSIQRDKNRFTPLMAAIVDDHGDLAELLLDHGADPSLALQESGENLPAGTSPLLFALALGRDSIASSLIERGAAVNATVPVPDARAGPQGAVLYDPPFRWPSELLLPGVTPLLLAINGGMVRNVELLLQAQADPNQPLPLAESSVHGGPSRELSGATPLMMALNLGHDDIVRLLIDHGADVNYAIPVRGAEDGPDGTVIYEPPFREPSKIFLPGSTALLLAAIGKREESVRLLLEAGADPNVTFPLTEASVSDHAAEQVSGITPLIAAAAVQDAGIVRALVAGGAEINYRVPEDERTGGMFANTTVGATALRIARANGNKEIVEILEQAAAGG